MVALLQVVVRCLWPSHRLGFIGHCYDTARRGNVTVDDGDRLAERFEADSSEVENLGGWLTTIVARVSLNMLRARRSRREQPLGLGVHVPDPIISHQDGIDPEQEALLAEGVGLALLVVLDTLAPAERLAFVLHDMFAVPFDEIASIVGRTPT